MTVRKLDRRDFVKIGVTAGGGLALGISLASRADAETSEIAGLGSGADAFQPNAFLRLDPDGSLTIWCGKADMGQGVRTSLPMIVADEMDADWSRVRTVQADAHPEKYGRQMTVGSSSVRRGGWTGLRVAGASAREMLVAAGATALGVPVSELTTDSGRVIHEGSGRSLEYGELAVAASELPVPESPRLKSTAEFTLIGTDVPLVDTEDKVAGRAVFGLDVRVPGMLFATVAKPRILGGSLVSMDEAAARAVPGVRDVFQISSGIAVVADNTWSAFEGANALDCQWDGDFRMSSPEISAHTSALCEGDAEVAMEVGNAPGVLTAASGRTVTATYEVPYLAHATMEPMNCTAHVQADRCEVWAPTQNPQGAQQTAAQLTGLPIERVTTHVTYMGCGWGRRSRTDFVVDAVETAMQLDVPVQVTWSREEDMRNDQYRPASMIRFEGAAEAGRLEALTARVAGPPLGVTDPRGRGGSGVDRNAVDGVVTMTYTIPNLLVDYARSEIQVPTGYWRSVGPSGNCFMVESFIDEMAHAAGRDPLEFRLAMLDDHPRMKQVLEKAAEMADWGGPVPAGRGRGIGIVEDKGGIVAQVAEVSVEDGEVRVHRVWCAADCGQIIHPGIVDAQLTGSIVTGLTMALYGEITIEDGRVVQSNFHDYDMLRMGGMPEVEVHIVRNEEEPGGVGEPAVPAIAPAVTNALFALTGERVRKLPIRLA